MYEAFYGFKEKPFSMLPDPSFLFLSKKHKAALTLLEYGLMNQVGFCVLSGEPGTGKTTILRALLKRVDDNITVGMISNTHQSFGGLLDWILSVYDLHQANLTQVGMHQIFVDFLISEYANNRRVLLIVDEAQNMDPESLEELRMLSNVNTEKDQLLQVVLSGQPELKENLRKPELMQFAQRIAVDYHLDALNLSETCGYIQHRLVVAGAVRDAFTPEACERIHCYSGGSPRLINLLCETALVYGFADEQTLIGADLVEEMVHERMKDSVVPLVNRDSAKEALCNNNEQLVKDFPWIRPEGGTRGLKPVSNISSAHSPEMEFPGVAGSVVTPFPASSSAGLKPTAPRSTESRSTVTKSVQSESIQQKAAELEAEASGASDDFRGVSALEEAPLVDTSAINLTANKQAENLRAAEENIRQTQSQASDSLHDDVKIREKQARNQIPAAAPKQSKLKKFGIYTGVLVLGLIIAGLFFKDYLRNNSTVFEQFNPQLKDDLSLNKKRQDKQEVKNLSGQTAGKLSDDKQKELKQKELEQKELEQKALEQKKLDAEKTVREKAEKEKVAQDEMAREKVAKEKTAKDKIEKEKIEKAIAEKKAIEQRKLKASEEAAESRRIVRQIQQREAELTAQTEARLILLEAEARLEEVNRIEQQQEAKRLEAEWLEKEQENFRAEEVKKKQQATVSEVVAKPKKKLPANCVGPTARFKAACR